eukprot:5891299-Prymnesium_polylepis.1
MAVVASPKPMAVVEPPKPMAVVEPPKPTVNEPLEVLLAFKGAVELATIEAEATTDEVFEAAARLHGLEDQDIKLVAKGQQLKPGVAVSEALLGEKVMVMATPKA